MTAGERLPAVATAFVGSTKAADAADAAADASVDDDDDDEAAMGFPTAGEAEQVLHVRGAADVSRAVSCVARSTVLAFTAEHGGPIYIPVPAVHFGPTRTVRFERT